MHTNNPCFVNVATDKFVPRQTRLRESLYKFHGNVDTLFYTDELPPGSPTHKMVPYAFKTFAMIEALKRGYSHIYWIDTSLVLQKPADKLFKYVDETGYYFQNNYGYNTGEWCCDNALKTLKIDREESFKLSHINAALICLDVNNTSSLIFLMAWHGYANDDISFIGPATNKNCECSKHGLVRGHRWDQTVASVLAVKLNLKIENSLNFVHVVPQGKTHNDKIPEQSLFSQYRG